MANEMWRVRESPDDFDADMIYDLYEDLFSMKIHHGGAQYLNGKVTFVDLVDPDQLSIHEFNAIMKHLGYHGTYMMYYHFLIPNSDLDFGLQAFACDQDVLRLLEYVPKCKLVSFYIEHGTTRLQTYFMSPEPKKVIIEELSDDNSPELNRKRQQTEEVGSSSCRRRLCLGWEYKEDEIGKSGPKDGNGKDVMEDDQHGNEDVHGVGVKAVEDGNLDFGNQDGHGVGDKAVEDGNQHGNEDGHEGGDKVVKDGNQHGNEDGNQHGNEDGHGVGDYGFDKDILDDFDPFFGETYSVDQQDGDEGVEKRYNETDESDDEGDSDSDYLCDEDDIDYMAEVDMTSFNDNVDWEAEWVGNEKVDKEEVEYEDEDPMDFEDFESDSSDSLGGARKKELKKLKKMHGKEDISGAEYSFYVGQTFGTREEVKKRVTMYSMHSCRDIRIIKNDNTRFRATCKGQNPVFNEVGGPIKKAGGPIKKAGGSSKKANASGVHCSWVLHVSTSKNDSTWTVKTYVGDHTCLQARKVNLCTARILSQHIQEEIATNPDIPLKTLHEQIQKKFQIRVSSQQVFRAKQMATRQVRGDYSQQYLLLRDYLEELQRSNPGTTVKLELEIEPNLQTTTRQFKRVYICLGALKNGFKALGRDLLGLDGSFMKGPYPGQILTAVGVDPNHGIYPLAYAIVEAETTNSWTWFLECLGDDLELVSNSNFTFISDRQKGIIPAIAKVFPAAEHRFCVRHIQQNMKQSWKGKVYNDMLWRCASATTIPQFHAEMEELRKFNAETYNWLKQIPPHHWSRSHFTGRAVCDVLLNNMCEVFNKQLLGGRDKPILTALEFIREYLMRRLALVQKVIDKTHGPLTPTIAKMLIKTKKEASQLVVLWNGEDDYQIKGAWGEQCCVNLVNKFCSCRKWELTGIPCKHAIAAIWFSAANGGAVALPENWVHPFYHLDTWKKMYQFKIKPTNGRLLWPKSSCPFKMLPPKHHKQIGRPKKCRRKTEEELSQPLVKGGKLLKTGKSMTCRICRKEGHNARTCKGKGTTS
ncbi:hypothetical protein OSB04_020605 [Centaurea solstitialis]|uniref:SWIM-type domain-containing protein n=1 Tax=Centaurea solstitialis TaxID=347529 RepID=A0AA38W418_9ASTR|nr:hypothetical protein OSB04_020605 [Centaurea solstitialis]